MCAVVGQTVSTGGRDSQLVHEALQALFDIAWADDAPDVARSIRQQLDGLTPEARAELLEGMVDTALLARLVDQVEAGQTPPLDALDAPLDEQQAALVDAAFRPLATLAGRGDRLASGDDLEPEARARILFAAVNRFGGLP